MVLSIPICFEKPSIGSGLDLTDVPYDSLPDSAHDLELILGAHSLTVLALCLSDVDVEICDFVNSVVVVNPEFSQRWSALVKVSWLPNDVDVLLACPSNSAKRRRSQTRLRLPIKIAFAKLVLVFTLLFSIQFCPSFMLFA